MVLLVFVAASCRDGASPEPEEEVESGRLLWRVLVASQGVVAQDAERVYFASGQQHAATARFKRDGKTAWHAPHRLGQGSLFGDGGGVLAGPVVVFHDSILYAYDRLTGRRRWTFDVERSPEGASTLGVDDASLTIYAGSPSGEVIAIDALTGQARWRRTPLVASSGTYNPVHDGGQVFVGFDGGLASLDGATGALQWETPFAPFLDSLGGSTRSLGNVVVAGNTVYAAAERGVIVALDRTTGTLRWRRILVDRESPLFGSPMIVLAGGRLVVRMFRGELYGLDPQSGEVVWLHAATNGLGFARPTTDSRAVYFTELSDLRARLVAVDGATGEKIWGNGLILMFGTTLGGIAVDDRAIYVGGSTTMAIKK
jgi:outer membrane protein assembly factor BamB